MEGAALVAERVAGAHREAPRGRGTGAGPVTMDYSTISGSPTWGSSGNGSHGSDNNSDHSNDKRICYYCKQLGHFMLSYHNLKYEMEPRASRHYLQN